MSYFYARCITRPSFWLHSTFLILQLLATSVAAVELEESTSEVHPIINGEAATETRTWMTALVRRSSSSSIVDRQFCGGVLIAPRWVLTAAHCVYERSPGDYQVLIGQQDLSASNAQLNDVVEHITNPYYNSGSKFYDIALLRLATPSTKQVAPLATKAMEDEAMGNVVQVLGWGTTAWDEDATCTMHFLDAVTNPTDFTCKTWVYSPSVQPQGLMKTGITLQLYEQCDRRFKAVLDKLKIPYGADALFSSTVSPGIFCAWDDQEDSTPCYGDSGGPVVRTVDGVEHVFGIASGGLMPDCMLTDQIGIFGRVSYFRSFIDYTMNRGLELGHTRLCPGSLAPTVSYAARQDGRQDVKLSWSRDAVAEGYRVFYAPHQSMGNNAQKLELPADNTELSVALASGQKFFVAVQARSARCDGPLSSLVMVKVP